MEPRRWGCAKGSSSDGGVGLQPTAVIGMKGGVSSGTCCVVFSFRIPTTSDSEGFREEVKAREAIANGEGNLAMR